MAASPLKTYVMALWNAQKAISAKLGGPDIRTLSLELRVVLILVDLVLGMLLQAMVDAGILTDAAIQARVTAVVSSAFKKQPEDVPRDDEDLGTHAVDPDLGV